MLAGFGWARPVRLQGVDIGNVTGIGVVTGTAGRPGADQDEDLGQVPAADPQGCDGDPGHGRRAGRDVCRYRQPHWPKAKCIQNGDVLQSRDTPQIEDVVQASQSTLQNIDVLLKRTDRIIAYIESGQGSIGKLIYDQDIYNKLNATLTKCRRW